MNIYKARPLLTSCAAYSVADTICSAVRPQQVETYINIFQILKLQN